MKKFMIIALCFMLALSMVPAVSANDTTGTTSVPPIHEETFEDPQYSPDPVSVGSLANYAITNGAVGSYFAQLVPYTAPVWAANADNKVFKLSDNGSGSVVATRTLAEKHSGKTIVAEFDYRYEGSATANNHRVIRLRSSGGDIVFIETMSGAISYRYKDPVSLLDKQYMPIVPSGQFKANVWYHFKIQVNLNNAASGVTVTVTDETNNVYQLNNGVGVQFWDAATTTTNSNLAKFDHSTSGGSAGVMYYDNFRIYEPQLPPNKPANVSAVAGNTQISLSWGAADGATSYSVKRKSGSEPYVTVAQGLTSLYFEDGNLVNDTTYTYLVEAVNVNGSTPSDEILVTPNGNVPLPAKTEGLQGTVLDSSVMLKWNKVAPSGSETISYIVKRSTSVDGEFTQVNSAPIAADPDEAIVLYLDSMLTNDTNYYYKVIAASVAGKGEESDVLKIAPRAPLSSPTGISAQGQNNAVKLSWNSVGAASDYSVLRSTKSGGPYELVAAQITGNSYTDQAVVNGTTYYYVVTAKNAKTTSMISAQASAAPYAAAAGTPAAPTGFQATAHDGKVSLSWREAGDASSYSVQRRAHNSGTEFAEIASVPAGSGSYEDTTVVNGTEYDYVVAAVNANGTGGYAPTLVVLPAETLTVDPSQPADPAAKRFATIQSAVDSLGTTNAERKVIFIRSGVYVEKVTVTQSKVSFVGEDRDATIIRFDDYGGSDGKSGRPGSTFQSMTVQVTGDQFTASNLTIENSAAPRDIYGTAVALSLKGDKAVFDNVKLLGYQDTLYNAVAVSDSTKGRQYFRNSIIQGDVDFIFGEAPAVVIENSDIISATHPSSTKTGGYITAAGQTKPEDPGYVFINSRLIKDPTAKGDFYLGRPWKNSPKVRFINTWIDSNIISAGWKSWNVEPAFYGEYNSYGPGANAYGRSSALSRQMSAEEANALTVPQIFGDWDPTAVVIMPGVKPNPTLGQTSVLYDKNPALSADVQVSVQFSGDVLSEISNGGVPLIAGQDYVENNNGIVLQKAYLEALSFGSSSLQVRFGSGAVLPVTVNVIDSSFAQQPAASEAGWASQGEGVSGGIGANGDNVYVVSNRSELIRALGGNNTTNRTNSVKKIIYVKGTIDANVDDNNNPLGYNEYIQGTGYTLEQYLADPTNTTLEQGRSLAQKAQAARVQIYVGSNTSIIGLGEDAKIVGANLMLDNVKNIIIRNIEFQNAHDFFPQWDPTDGSSGNWNSKYDNISVTGSGTMNIWIDHNSFNDLSERFKGIEEQYYFGKHYQNYDGFIDITKQADLVTLSYNHFANHDKTMLIGSSDSDAMDMGRLRTTIHHNYFENIVQRAPRVRYGQIHLYNNYYNSSSELGMLYSVGVGASSQIISENNYFENVRAPIAYYDTASAGAISDTGSQFVNSSIPTWKAPVSWTPIYAYQAEQAGSVRDSVLQQAGAKGRTLTPASSTAELGLKVLENGSQVQLSWPTVSGASSYNVKRSTQSGGPYLNVAAVPAAPNVLSATYTDHRESNEAAFYYYRVSAVGSNGEFVSWPEISVATVPVVIPTIPSMPGDAPTILVSKSLVAGGAQVTVTAAAYGLSQAKWSAGSVGISDFSNGGSGITDFTGSFIPSTVTENVYQGSFTVNTLGVYTVYVKDTNGYELVQELTVSELGSTLPPVIPEEDGDDGAGTDVPAPGTPEPTNPTSPSAPTTPSDEDDDEAPASTSSGGAAQSASPAQETGKKDQIILNGQKQDNLLTRSAEGSQQVFTIDSGKLTEMVKNLGAKAIVEIPVTDAGDKVKIKLSGSILNELNRNGASLKITTDFAEYAIPVGQISLSSIAERLGNQAAVSDMNVQLIIEKASGQQQERLKQNAQTNGFRLVGSPVDFSVQVTAGNQSVEVNRFTEFVERSIPVPAGENPDRITTAVVLEADGSIRHVPTSITVREGQYYADIRSLTNSTYSLVANDASFVDTAGHWGDEIIRDMASRFVINGFTKQQFSPDRSITRAEYAAILIRGLGLPNDAQKSEFSDVRSTDWFSGAISQAKSYGLIQGYEDGTFRPNSAVTREEAIVMLNRAMKLAGLSAGSQEQQSAEAVIASFQDSSAISTWAKPSLSSAVAAGLVGGYNNMLNPSREITRAEAAAMVHRLLVAANLINAK
ncbi:pectinesterase family protein [Paenibacillus turpanensis]|uniref:pectinesterase family protein n=1 Tax=Paenibacillus turpanensis TaxID=2689078 RepID=UPI00140C5EB1|nr:pectinesterase family protein [Paenibacillus turpanensis]